MIINKMFMMVKKLIIVLLIIVGLIAIEACSVTTNEVGTGIKGEVADIPWTEYDDLINKIKTMKNSKERDYLMHKAEEMLINEYCYIPVDYSVTRSICKKNLKNIFIDKSNIAHLDKMRYDDGRKIANLQLCDEPQILDPQLGEHMEDIHLLSIAFARLFDYDENNMIVPSLVDTYSISEDQKTYRFTLKDNLKWSDGVPLTVYDCEYGIRRGCKLGIYGFILSAIEGYPNNPNVKVISDKELCITLSVSCPYFLSSLANVVSAPLRKDIIDGNDDWHLQMPMVTSGAYYIDKWNHKSSIIYKKNPYYYNANDVEVETINVMLSGDKAVIYNAYLTSDIDFAIDVPTDIVSDEFSYWNYEDIFTVKINTKNKIFEGFTREEARKIREAISNCIDREFIASISNNLRKPSYNIITPIFNNYQNKSFVNDAGDYKYPYKNGMVDDINLDKARELLKEVGYHFDDNGKLIEELVFELMANTENYDIVSVIQIDLAKIGITAKIKKRSAALVDKGDYFASYSIWAADYSDPLAMIEFFTSDNINNNCFLGK